ncbi:MAG: tetratricopeptide repeat protein [Saprospirales bacterium]|nr:tetratricopeptide repeat protein [Saprospirales bacterium]
MKTLTVILLAGFYCISLVSQTTLSPSDWQSDLRFLQKTVHEDYPFLFKKVKKETFDAEVEKLHAAIPSMQKHEVIVGLARIVALFQYGHTAIGLSGWAGHGPAGFQHMPFNLYHFSDGVFVQGVHKDYERALGAKVLKVEGMPVEKALEAIRPVVSSENDQFFKAFGLRGLGMPEVLHAQGVTQQLKETVTLTLQKDAKTFEVAFSPIQTGHFPGSYGLFEEKGDWLDARDNSQTPLYLKNLDRIYFYEYLPEHKAVYVRHSQIQDDPQEDIPAFYERLFQFIEENEVERLILDVRLNGGGDNFKNKPIVTGIIRTEKINQAGKFFVITGRRTFSACQNLVNELDNYTNCIFVGEPTAENINFYGDTEELTLPKSNIPVYLSFAWWQDKPQWVNDPWTAPHLAVDMSFEDFRSNRDPVLETALTASADNLILDPMAYMTGLYQAGKLDELKAEAKKIIVDPTYRYFDFETEFNETGYRLLNRKNLEPATFLFELNTELFPGSANAWDSLGEAHWAAGHTAKAIEFYQKAVQLDPNGSVGDNARRMQERIRSGEKRE